MPILQCIGIAFQYLEFTGAEEVPKLWCAFVAAVAASSAHVVFPGGPADHTLSHISVAVWSDLVLDDHSSCLGRGYNNTAAMGPCCWCGPTTQPAGREVKTGNVELLYV